MTRQRKRDLIACVPMVIIFALTCYFTSAERAFALAVTLYLFYVVISERWSARHNLLYWIIVLVFLVAHVTAIALFRFPPRISPAMIAMPIAVFDAVAMYYLLGIADRRGRQ